MYVLNKNHDIIILSSMTIGYICSVREKKLLQDQTATGSKVPNNASLSIWVK
jgi:hypothetical protein